MPRCSKTISVTVSTEELKKCVTDYVMALYGISVEPDYVRIIGYDGDTINNPTCRVEVITPITESECINES